MSDVLERLSEALTQTYRFEGPLGEGGMATVYRAVDLKHDRPVAVKVIHPDIAASLGGERFLREIQITAKLNHPHILGLYDSGEAAGILYYVMPLVEGESLRGLIDREQQLGIHEAVRIAREIADALGHAHSLGLVHRDIKPENVLLSGGHAIVADFGIARAVSASAGDGITQTGAAIGTPAYMSPEQAAGDSNLDGRSDVYALGCVLYEMLVGQPPFTGPNPQAVMARHTMDHVPPPQIVRQSIPNDLEDIILCALQKAPADRFRTASAMVDALTAIETGQHPKVRLSSATRTSRMSLQAEAVPARRRWMIPAGVVAVLLLAGVGGWLALRGRAPVVDLGGLDRRTIAVTYFEDLSADQSLGYLADGLTEGLIDKLAETDALAVISRNGVALWRGAPVTRDSIARALGAGTLVAGTVEPVGDRIQITVRLLDGSTATDFDRASFTLPAANALAALDSVTDAVARGFRASLGGDIRIGRLRAGTSNPDAWLLVQRAERERKAAADAQEDADIDGLFDHSAAADSLATLAGLADPRWAEPPLLQGEVAYRLTRVLLGDRVEAAEYAEVARAHAERALALEPNLPRALELRGTVRYLRWLVRLTPDGTAPDSLLEGARIDLVEATRRDRTRASAFSTLSHLYYQTDDIVAAVLAAERAYQADAYLDVANEVLWRLFVGQYDLGNFQQASEACARGERRFPHDHRFVRCQLTLMTTGRVDPDPDRAWSLLARLDSLAPETLREVEYPLGLLTVGGVLGRAGLTDSARAVMRAARVDRNIDPEQELMGIEAFMRTLAGDTVEAVRLLRNYVAANPEHSLEIGGDLHWWWRGLRDHPDLTDVFVRRR